jgi:thiamine pyrophosphate-dependent acetolactate synthase large subunit-like protein
VRAYKIAMTPPMAPVVLVADTELQRQRVVDEVRIPKVTLPTPPAGEAAAAAEAAKLAESSRQALDKARQDASYGWDASPISTARLSMELYAQIKNEDWSLVSETSP